MVHDHGPSDESLTKEGEEDYRFARERIKKLIDTSDDAIAKMHDLATDAEHPRAFEVLGGLIKQAAEMNGQLLDLQKQRRVLLNRETSKKDQGASVNNTSIFVGTTADLQKFLKNRGKEQPIVDV
jgi:hypothetical protein